MTYEMLRTVFIAGAVLSVLMLLISVFLFLFLNIPMIIGELTGTNARKGIAQIRDKAVQSTGNSQTGKLALGVHASIAGHQSSAGGGTENDITEKILTEELHHTGAENETARLGNMQREETALLECMQQETTLLRKMENGTSGAAYGQSMDSDFQIEYEITYIHTDEKIEE